MSEKTAVMLNPIQIFRMRIKLTERECYVTILVIRDVYSFLDSKALYRFAFRLLRSVYSI